MLIFLRLSILFIIMATYGSRSHALTLEDVIRKALETNPNILAGKSSQRASEEAIDVARAGYFPSLDLANTGGPQYTKEVSKLGPLSLPFRGSDTLYMNDAAITFTQLLFDGFETLNKVAQAESQFEASSKEVENTEGSIALQACQAFFDVLAKKALKEIAEENIAVIEDILDKVKRRLDAQIGTRADLEQVQARLGDAFDALLAAQGELERSISVFLSVVGELPKNLQPTSLPHELLPKSLPNTLTIAFKKDPSILVAQKRYDVAIAEFNQTEAPFLPKFHLEAGAQQQHNPQGEKANIGEASILVVGTYNLYRGGGDTAQMRSQAEKVTEAKYRIAIEHRNTEKDVMMAWADRDTSSKRIKELSQTIDLKKKVVEDYTIQFVIGGRFLLDILIAQQDYLRSKIEIVTAKTVHEVSIAQLLMHVGELAPYYKDKKRDTEIKDSDAPVG